MATVDDMLDYWYRDQPSEYEKDFAVPNENLVRTALRYKKQVSPTYYSKYEIEPAEFIIKNGLGFAEGNVIKYICRYSEKGGREDLEKAKEYIDLLIENKNL